MIYVPYNTCYMQMRDFEDERKLLTDQPYPGAPKLKMNETLVVNVKSQINNDPNVSVREISSDLDVS